MGKISNADLFPVRVILDPNIPREKIIIDLIKRYPSHSRPKTALLREALLLGIGSAMQLYPPPHDNMVSHGNENSNHAAKATSDALVVTHQMQDVAVNTVAVSTTDDSTGNGIPKPPVVSQRLASNKDTATLPPRPPVVKNTERHVPQPITEPYEHADSPSDQNIHDHDEQEHSDTGGDGSREADDQEGSDSNGTTDIGYFSGLIDF